MNFFHRLRTQFRKQKLDQELSEELAFHIQQETEENIAAGMSAEEARYAAMRKFGGIDQVKEECRDAWGVRFIDTLLQDLRFGLRMLRKNPGFTAVAVITLALGIGANTAVFTLVDAVMIKTLPVIKPQQLVLLGWVKQGNAFRVTKSGYGLADAQLRDVRASFAYPFIDELRSQSSAFSNVFGFVPMGWSRESVTVSIDGQASTADSVMVTGDYFSGLGVLPFEGRMLTDADMKPGAPRAAVTSYSYWTRNFGRSPSAVGKTAFINGEAFTIVGVAPPEFFGVQPGQAPDFWIPLIQDAKLGPWGQPPAVAQELWTRPDWWWVMVMARLKPGASEKQAIAAATGPFLRSVMAVGQKDLLPVDLPQLVFVPASRGLETLRWGFSQPLWILTGVVGLVLLIACANIATLLLARAMARGREIGVRQALGASRWRLLRQLLTESVLLSILGGALGLLLAQWGGRALLLLMSGGDTVLNLGRPDLTVLGFCAGVSVLTGILFSLAPAIHAIRLNPAPTLKKAASGLGRLGSHLRLGKALVVVQVALGLLLLIGAGLFIRTLANLETQNLGFDRHNLLVFTIDPTKSGYEGPRIPRLCENVRERLHAVPGVQSVTYSQLALLTGWMNNGPISIEGYQAKLGQDMGTEWDPVGPDFFRTMGIRLILGRAIDRRDTGGSPRVAVINQAMARYFFGVKSPIGQRLSLDEKFNPANAAEIIGVVENAKYESLRADSRMIYFALNQSESALGKTFFEVRTAGSPLAAVSTIRAAIHDLDSSLALADLKTQNQIIAEQLGNERMMAELLSLFSLLALALAAIGLYGLMAYTVTQRTNEIGIRMALGAQRNQVLVLMLRQSILLVAVGVMVGLLAGIGAARLIASQLFGLKPTDPLTFAVAALSMFAVASVAAFIPARRATQVDPMVALRHE